MFAGELSALGLVTVAVLCRFLFALVFSVDLVILGGLAGGLEALSGSG